MTVVASRPAASILSNAPLPLRPPTRRRGIVRWATWITLGAGILLWLAFWSFVYAKNPAKAELAVGLAALPVPVLLLVFRRLDRAAPKPRRYLFVAFAWGATVAPVIALGGELALRHIPGWLSAGVVEEAAKGAVLVGLVMFVRDRFSGIIDGIVYGGFVATGFLFSEDCLFYSKFYGHGDHGAVAKVAQGFFLRGILTVWGHPLYTILIGIGLGVAAVSTRRAVRVMAPVGGYAGAATTHAFYDYSCLHPHSILGAHVIVVVLLGWVAVVVATSFATTMRGVHLRALEPYTWPYVTSGHLSPWEVAGFSSMKGRRDARRRAGPALGDVQHIVTRLALLRRDAEAGRGRVEFVARERELLSQLAQARRALAYAAQSRPLAYAAQPRPLAYAVQPRPLVYAAQPRPAVYAAHSWPLVYAAQPARG
jgi:RsiW-degrading membrane proteinase PrsW (M82 family)